MQKRILPSNANMSASNLTDKTDFLEILSANASSFALPEGLLFDSHREADRCLELGVQVLTLGRPGYPELLASIPDPPKVLYVRGRLPAAGALALVGSRRPSSYGLRTAKRLSADAARAGIVTVSGMARGIDTEVHRSTMAAQGVTWAVLGSGLDRIYPPENAVLAERIVAQGGALISEVPMSGPPLAANFPRRNRIISGLAWGTVVVEGDGKSGALIPARCSAGGIGGAWARGFPDERGASWAYSGRGCHGPSLERRAGGFAALSRRGP
jgi:DNA protecting protein DprA